MTGLHAEAGFRASGSAIAGLLRGCSRSTLPNSRVPQMVRKPPPGPEK